MKVCALLFQRPKVGRFKRFGDGCDRQEALVQCRTLRNERCLGTQVARERDFDVSTTDVLHGYPLLGPQPPWRGI